MTILQLIMLAASAYFAFKIYEHIGTLKDSDGKEFQKASNESTKRTKEAFSTFDVSDLLEKADKERENNNLDKAMAIYSEANIKSPNSDEILFKMGYTLALQGRDEEALEYFEDALKVDQNNPFTYVEMYKIYKKQGDNDKAEFYHQKAIEIDENFRNI